MIDQRMDHAPSTSLEPDAPRRHRLLWLGAAAIIVLGIVAYLPALEAGFIWDDESYVTQNKLLTDVDGLKQIWIPRKTPQYYPVVFTSFWIEYQIWKLEPFGYHLVNIVLHLLNALLLWAVCRALKFPGVVAWLVALIFALHPVHVESVAWITERKNVLSGFFYLSAALAYLRYQAIRDGEVEGTPTRESWGFYGIALLLFVLALLSKSVTCTLPAALILVMLWQRKPHMTKNIAATVIGSISIIALISACLLMVGQLKEFKFIPTLQVTGACGLAIGFAIPFVIVPAFRKMMDLIPLVVLGGYAAMNTAAIERDVVGAVGVAFEHSFIERCLIASKALLFYPGKIIWPWPLMFNYPRWSIDAGDILSYWSVALVFLIGLALLAFYFKGWRGPFLALAFFAGTVLPALGFVNVYPHQFSFVADHFQYLASIGVIILAVSVLHRLIASPKKLILVVAAPALILLGLTRIQIGDYLDIETLWRNTLAKNPEAWMPHNNLSSILLKQAEVELQRGENADSLIEEARHHAQTTIDLKPNHHTAHSNLSEALRLQKQYTQALEHITIAVAERPFWPEHHRNQGRLLELSGDPDAALDSYRRTVSLDPNHVLARLDLARLYVARQDLERAAAQYEEILDRQPNNFMALGTLANLRVEFEQYGLADAMFQRAFNAAQQIEYQIQIAMRHAVFLLQCPDPAVRNPAKAIFIVEQVVQATNRSLPNTLDVLAMAYAAVDRFQDAIATTREAAALARSVDLMELATEYEGRLDFYLRNELPPLATPKSE